MFDKFFRGLVRFAYVFSVCLMIAFLPHSKFMLSLSQFIMLGAFALERYDLNKVRKFFSREGAGKILLAVPFLLYLLFRSIVAKFRIFFRNKPAVIFSSIYLLHITGLFITTDFDYAIKDLRTKVPLFIIPLFLSTTSAFNKKQFRLLLLLFITSVLVRTLINTYNFVEENFIDIRDISKTISHIIVSLLISLSVFMMIYFIIRKRIFMFWMKPVFVLLILWFIAYMIISRSGTGLVISSVTLVILFVILMFMVRNELFKISFVALMIIGGTALVFYFSRVYHDYHKTNPVDLSKLEKNTALGNPYTHDTSDGQTENGNYVYLYIQFNELQDAWNRRSIIRFDSTDRKNQPIVGTILRFLTSKGLRKDASGVNALTDEEVKAIENGTANVIFTESFSIKGLLYELMWGYDEYMATGNPTGSSLMQRLEFWKASVGIIKENWLTGVGTGDMNIAFERQYEKMKTKLPPEQRWRSHDQFLSIFIGFGIFGLIWFLFAIFYPPYLAGKYKDYFFLVFFIIALLSMISEDTIETQAGVTFFAFFYSFFLFARKEEDKV